MIAFLKFLYNYFFKRYFYDDKDFVQWIQNSKVLIILRGPIGSKKLSLADNLKMIGCNKFVVGDRSVIAVASLMESDTKHIFVDVCSLKVADIEPYIKLGRQFFYMIVVPDFMNTWQDDILELSLRTSGDTHANDIVNFEEVPVYYAGWFLSDADQQRLHIIGRECLEELWKIDSFREQLEANIGSADVNKYWPQQKDRLHVTSNFIDRKCPSEYMGLVSGAMCTMCDIRITAILLTPRTFSCHVVLSGTDMWLFEDRELVTTKPHVTLAVGGSTKAVQSGPDQIEVQSLIGSGVTCKEIVAMRMGMARDFDLCRFYVALDEPIMLRTLFNVIY